MLKKSIVFGRLNKSIKVVVTSFKKIKCISNRKLFFAVVCVYFLYDSLRFHFLPQRNAEVIAEKRRVFHSYLCVSLCSQCLRVLIPMNIYNNYVVFYCMKHFIYFKMGLIYCMMWISIVWNHLSNVRGNLLIVFCKLIIVRCN